MTVPTEPDRALILWSDRHSSNLGVRALAAGAATVLEEVLPASAVMEFQDFGGRDTGFRITPSVLVRNTLRRRGRGPLDRHLLRYRWVLDTGAGDSLTDIYGVKRLVALLYLQYRSRVLARTVILLPQTVGPFESPTCRWIVRRVLSGSQIFARDSPSAALLKEMGLDCELAATDLSFAIRDKGNDWSLETIGLGDTEALQQDRAVAVNVSGLLWERNAHVDSTTYRKLVELIVRRMVSMGYEPILVPHVLENVSSDNDCAVLAEAQDYLGIDRVVVPGGLSEVRALLRSCRVSVGARMHFCLNSIAVGTPTLALGYSRKVEGLLDDLRYPFFFNLNDSALSDSLVDESLHRLIAHGHLHCELSRRLALDRIQLLTATLGSLV